MPETALTNCIDIIKTRPFERGQNVNREYDATTIEKSNVDLV